MNLGRQLATLVTVLALLCGVACKSKKPHLPLNAQAPTLSVPMPEQIEEAETPAPEPPKTTQAATVTEPPKTKPPRRRSSKKPPPPVGNAQNNAAPNPAAASTMAAIRPPASPAAEGPPDMAIAADVSSEQLNVQKQTTAQLLDSAEKILKNLNRGLNHDEEAMVGQVKTYIAQSRKATADGDFERAYNLATKAHLLSDALVKK